MNAFPMTQAAQSLPLTPSPQECSCNKEPVVLADIMLASVVVEVLGSQSLGGGPNPERDCSPLGSQLVGASCSFSASVLVTAAAFVPRPLPPADLGAA